MRSHFTRRRGRVEALYVVMILAVLAVLLAAGAFYYAAIKMPADARVREHDDLIIRMVGLANQPVANRLDPQFKDQDGDLVADTPSDPAQQIDPLCFIFRTFRPGIREKYRGAFKEFTQNLEKATGKKVEYVLLESTQEELRALRDGKLHIAGIQTGAVPIAVNVAGFIPCASTATADGVATYQTQIIVPADSSMHGPADLRGHDLLCTDPASNSGFKAPLVLLKSDFNLLPARDYQIRCSNSHDHSIELVAKHECEAAAVASSLLTRAIAAGTIKEDQFRVIYKSENFPNAAI